MNPQHKQRGRVNVRLLSWLGIVLFFLLALGYFFYGLQPVSSGVGRDSVVISTSTSTTLSTSAGAIQFKITKGESFKNIGSRLSQKSLIRSISVFKLYSFIIGKAHTFQPGAYTLSETMSIPQIIDILTVGGANDVTVTIPEGYSLRDIDATLHDAGVLNGDSLVSYDPKKILIWYPELQSVISLEGVLFPDTYRFKLRSSADEVIKVFLDTFMTKAWPFLEKETDWYNRIVLASFLEREVPGFEDRRIVAGILLKRYALKMPLQVDATIVYTKCGEAFKDCAKKNVTKDDLTASSPYNTYQKIGWTPTPISNPGQSAIKAAVSPEKTLYFYYLSRRDTGETLFSKTLEEHNIKRAKYL